MRDEQIRRRSVYWDGNCDVSIEEDDQGLYVLYDDHSGAMDAKDARIRELEEACKVLGKAFRLWQIQNIQSFTDNKWKKFTIRREFAKRSVLDNPIARKYVEGKG